MDVAQTNATKIPSFRMTGAEIVAFVANTRGLTVSEIKGPRRMRKLVLARKEVATIARSRGFTAGRIARLLRKDITTVGAYLWPKLVERKLATRAARKARSA